jgi:hypothetical protein
VAKDTLTVQFQLQAPFVTVQALRRALADPLIQGHLVSLLSETITPFLARQVAADFGLTVALKVSAVGRTQPGPRLPLPKVEQDHLTWYDPYADRTNTVGTVGSAEWFLWLEAAGAKSFRYESDHGTFTALKEKRRGRVLWYAHRRQAGQLKRIYLGRTENLTATKLAEAARKLNSGQIGLTNE